MLILWFWLMTLIQQPAPVTFPLTIIGGTGSGMYLCGATVKIRAPRRRGGEVFAQWFAGWDGEIPVNRVTRPTATLTMPCRAATVEAKYRGKP